MFIYTDPRSKIKYISYTDVTGKRVRKSLQTKNQAVATFKAAKKFTRDFLTGKKITLKQCTRDKYFRLLCDVYADNKSLAEALLSENLAAPYDGGKK